MQQFNPNYPPAQALQAQIHSLNAAIAREEGRVGASLAQDYQSAVGRERMLSGRVNTLKAKLTDLRQRSIQYNIYERDADTNRQLYNALLQRYKEIGVAGGVEKNNVSIVDAPKLPDHPSSPNFLLNLLLGDVRRRACRRGRSPPGSSRSTRASAIPSDTEAQARSPLLGTVPESRTRPRRSVRKSALGAGRGLSRDPGGARALDRPAELQGRLR